MIPCKDCGKGFERPVQRGRPAVRCPECRAKDPNAVKAITEHTQAETVIEEKPVKLVEEVDTTVYQYVLMVGNMGRAFATDSEKDATERFNHYKNISSQGYGQVGFQTVKLHKLNRELNQYEVNKIFEINRDYK